MTSQLVELLDRLEAKGHSGLKNSISITWVRYSHATPKPGSGYGSCWSEQRLLYPASVVKLIYALAAEAWLQKDLIPDSKELREALKAMIYNSSNDATSLVVDLLTGTTSGPSLKGEQWTAWEAQRQLINKWLFELGWNELQGINCCQKTWSDGPYGREKDFYGEGNINRNSLSTSATARIMEAIMTDSIISPPACKRMKGLLSRPIDLMHRKADPENQVDGFLGEGLPPGTRLWSKAGLMSHARHDAAWFCIPGQKPMLIVVFTQGRQLATNNLLFPEISKELAKM